MAYIYETNRVYSAIQPEQVTTGVAGPTTPTLGRIFIDLGLAIATVVGTILTAGTGTVELLGLDVAATTLVTTAGSLTGLVTNTSIDIAEGNTDALTLGLDIGLPFATEALGAGLGLLAKNVVTANKLDILLATAGAETKEGTVGAGVIRKAMASYSRNPLTNTWDQFKIGLKQEGVKGIAPWAKTPGSLGEQLFMIGNKGERITAQVLSDYTKSIEASVQELSSAFKSLTDALDKLTGAARDYILKWLPHVRDLIKVLKSMLKKANDAIAYVTNPINKAIDAINKQVKPMLKRLDLGESKIKQNLMLIKQKADIRKQSILQNSLITQNNIQTVMSRWVLGYSIIASDIDEDTGEITNGHLVIWFIPEVTAHQGQRGATPEPMGKRPVVIPNLDQAGIDSIINEPDIGTYYYNNVAYDQSNSSLYNTGFSASTDSGADFLAGLFKNALSIIPGYSLYMGISNSISQLTDVGKRIVAGELGTDYVKQLTNYHNTLNRLGSAYIPKGIKSAAHLIERGAHEDYAALLKPAEKQVNGWADSISKRGQVKTVKHI